MPNQRHLKRLNAPRTWTLKRKENKYIAKPRAGPHKIEGCLTLGFLVKEVLKYAKTSREVKKIVNANKILIDKKPRKDLNFPVGLMDIIEVPETKEHFKILIDDKGRLTLHKITKEESNQKTCKIIGKTCLKKKKIQLNLYDGKNIILDKDAYSVGDSVIIDLEKNKVIKHLKLEKGASVLLIGGSYLGQVGILEEIQEQEGNLPTKIILTLDKDKIETRKEFVFVIDKHKK